MPVSLLSSEKAALLEPLIHAKGDVLISPTTGIIDAHEYMSSLEVPVDHLDWKMNPCHGEENIQLITNPKTHVPYTHAE